MAYVAGEEGFMERQHEAFVPKLSGSDFPGARCQAVPAAVMKATEGHRGARDWYQPSSL